MIKDMEVLVSLRARGARRSNLYGVKKITSSSAYGGLLAMTLKELAGFFAMTLADASEKPHCYKNMKLFRVWRV